MALHRTLQPQALWLTASLLLTAMSLMMFGSSWNDALTFDEPAHIAAGYAYLHLRDARLNHEHPPLLKMVSAVPLLLLSPHFPLHSVAWQDTNNGQWETARIFLYESDNNPHRIMVLARLGPMFMTLLLGMGLFLWTRRWAGDGPALLTLFLYVFSPTVLAHGRLVTTDVAAAFGVMLVGLTFSRFLTAPRGITAFIAGLALGVALLCKFSTFLLMPFLMGLTGLWMCLEPRRMWRYCRGLALVCTTAALLVLLCYLWITARYPPERQLRDSYLALFWLERGPAGRTGEETIDTYFDALRQDRTRDLLACAGSRPGRDTISLRRCAIEAVIFLADKPLLRAWAQYLYGLIWALNRARTGAIAAFPFYFLGEVSIVGRPTFFPVVYAVKEPLPILFLTGIALFVACMRLRATSCHLWGIPDWLRRHPTEVFMLGWIVCYWTVSITANLNIGVRHLLPVYPFTVMLVAREVNQWLPHLSANPLTQKAGAQFKRGCIALLLLWQFVSVLLVYPSFLAYFNEAVGGPKEGGKYVVDSNLDWGQDLRRLRAFVEAQGLDKIGVNYFGQSSPQAELGEKYVPWQSALGPYHGWLAVSATVLKLAQARWHPEFDHKAEDSYRWLAGKEPIATIGYSIFIYDLRPAHQWPKG